MTNKGSATSESTGTGLLYASIPRSNRPAYIPTIIVTTAIWFFSIFLVVAGLASLVNTAISAWTSLVLIAVGAALAGYLFLFTGKFLTDFDKLYEFELTDSEARLKVKDPRSNQQFIVRMPFSEVSFVEHFTPRDQVSLVFHGANNRIMEVPIWTMTNDATPAIEFLKSKKLKFINI